MPFFSIITPTIQRSNLTKACKSLNSQVYTDWEHIVMVDCAELDESLIATIAHSNRKVIKCDHAHKNYGNTCRHNAWDHATGRYLIYLDDDNWFMDDNILKDMQQAIMDADYPRLMFFPIQDRGNKMFQVPPVEGKIDTANLVVEREFGQWPSVADGDQDYTVDFRFIKKLYDENDGFFYGMGCGRPIINRPAENFGRLHTDLQAMFLVTSAIHTKHGKFTAEERLTQTVETLRSIKDRLPYAKILLFDSGVAAPLSAEEKAQLTPFTTELFEFGTDEQVKGIYASTDNWDVVKNFTELVVFTKMLNILVQNPDMLKGIDRVFKLSGRYLLTDDFLKNEPLYKHPGAADKYIFANRRNSQFAPQLTNGLQQQLMSRLWSWPASKTSLVLARYQVMTEDFIGSLNAKQYRDLEHLLLRYFSGPNLVEVGMIGVEGMLGPNGQVVKD